ncbi:Ankyrin repeat protein [Trichostrongylus colubriformis]|uniref:Ankyrin repeat protein n=1 Tax=Trichostrongylus colubriformis TaxID=6319 RepID=A0AAN8FLH6_TRICO
MLGFERTRQAADLFAKLICCANPQCSRESDNLQTLGTACKHVFCWDCINSYSRLDTFTLCPRCACPLDLHHPRSAQLFNNLAQHINEFKLLLREYEQALQNSGANAAATIAQTQKLFEVHAGISEDVIDQAARNEAINDFICTQKVSADEDKEHSPESNFSEEIYDTTPPKVVPDVHVGTKERPAVEFADAFDDFSDEEIKATSSELGRDGVITDSIPVLGQPMMTSTQKPTLFLSQAVHARSDLFAKESTQEIKTYHCEKAYNYFQAKPTKTFDVRTSKTARAPWLDLPPKRPSDFKEAMGAEHVSNNSAVTPKRDGDSKISRSGSKAAGPRPRSRKSSCSTPRAHSRSSDNPVFSAVLDGNMEEIRNAIDAGYDVNQRDEMKRTPLFIAVEMKRLDICQLLVERGGAVINAHCGSDCNTALHVAVSQESEEIVRYLLSKGASKTIRNIRQETPSQLAQRRSPLRSLVEKYRCHPKQPYVARLPDVYIVCYSKEIRKSLTYGEQAALNKLVTVVEFCDEDTTHYVVSADADGVASVDADLLRAMMQNTRIMGLDWLKECIRAGKTVPHSHFEVSKLRYMENNVVSDSLARCRKSKEKMEPSLFHGCIFYLLSNRYKGIDDRRLLPDLVRLGGGEIAVSEPQFKSSMLPPFHAPHLSSPIFVVYDVTHTKNIPSKFHRCPNEYNMVSAQWVIESVMEYAIKPIA